MKFNQIMICPRNFEIEILNQRVKVNFGPKYMTEYEFDPKHSLFEKKTVHNK